MRKQQQRPTKNEKKNKQNERHRVVRFQFLSFHILTCCIPIPFLLLFGQNRTICCQATDIFQRWPLCACIVYVYATCVVAPHNTCACSRPSWTHSVRREQIRTRTRKHVIYDICTCTTSHPLRCHTHILYATIATLVYMLCLHSMCLLCLLCVVCVQVQSLLNIHIYFRLHSYILLQSMFTSSSSYHKCTQSKCIDTPQPYY